MPGWSRRLRGQQGLAVLKEPCFLLFLLKREDGRDRIVLKRGNMIAPLSTSLISHLSEMCEYILNISKRYKRSYNVTHNLVVLKHLFAEKRSSTNIFGEKFASL